MFRFEKWYIIKELVRFGISRYDNDMHKEKDVIFVQQPNKIKFQKQKEYLLVHCLHLLLQSILWNIIKNMLPEQKRKICLSGKCYNVI